jgi:hypothetical protein
MLAVCLLKEHLAFLVLSFKFLKPFSIGKLASATHVLDLILQLLDLGLVSQLN